MEYTHMVDACIVSFNTAELTTACAKSYLKSDPLATHLTVWDNASSDGSVRALRKIRKVHTIASSENVGYGTALNRAFKGGTGKYVLCLNSDMLFPTQGWLTTLVKFMEKNPGIGACGPLLINLDDTIGGAGVVGTFQKPSIRYWGKPYNDVATNVAYPKEVLSICGACLLVRRDSFEQLNGFDERFFFYFEETNLCRHIIRTLGQSIWYYPVKVTHFWNKSPKESGARKFFDAGAKIYEEIWAQDSVSPTIGET